jgi:hypothetical protein
MSIAGIRRLWLGIVLLLSCAPVLAQGGGVGVDSGQQDAPSQPIDNSGNSAASGSTPWRFMMLYGAEMVERDSFSNRELGGWTSWVEGRISIGIERSKLRMYVGGSGVLEHDSSGTLVGAQGFMQPTIGVSAVLSRRLIWDGSVSVEYGGEVTRFFESVDSSGCDANCGSRAAGEQSLVLAQLQNDVSGASASELPVQVVVPELVRPVSLVIVSSTNGSQNLNLFGSTGVRWLLGPRRQLHVRFTHSEGELLTGNPQSNNIALARVTDSHRINERTLIYEYLQYHHYFQESCDSYGSGGGGSRYLSRRITFSGEAGAEYSKPSCTGQKWLATFTGNIAALLTEATRFSVGGGRDTSASYLPGSRWSDYAQASLIQRIGQRTNASFSFGYLRSSLTGTNENYHGDTTATRFSLRVTPEVYAATAYTYFNSRLEYGRPGQRGLNCNTLSFSLNWHPQPRRL